MHGLPQQPAKNIIDYGVAEKTNNGRIFQDGKFYRIRRGKLVQIPDEWVGQVTTPQTIRKRKSKNSQGRRYKRKCMR